MTTATRPTMTAEEARSFDHDSPDNDALVLAALSCSCQPRQDVFTFNRWIAQGFAVQRGQHAAVKVPVKKVIRSQDLITGEDRIKAFLTSSALFCRCQVAPIAGKAQSSSTGPTAAPAPRPATQDAPSFKPTTATTTKPAAPAWRFID